MTSTPTSSATSRRDRGGEGLARLDEAGEHRHPVAAEPSPRARRSRSSASTTAMMTAMSVRGVVLARVGGAPADPARAPARSAPAARAVAVGAVPVREGERRGEGLGAEVVEVGADLAQGAAAGRPPDGRQHVVGDDPHVRRATGLPEVEPRGASGRRLGGPTTRRGSPGRRVHGDPVADQPQHPVAGVGEQPGRGRGRHAGRRRSRTDLLRARSGRSRRPRGTRPSLRRGRTAYRGLVDRSPAFLAALASAAIPGSTR